MSSICQCTLLAWGTVWYSFTITLFRLDQIIFFKKMFYLILLPSSQLLFLPAAPPLLLRLWYEPMWQEGADVAEQRVRCLRPGPVGDRCKHRLLALPGGRRHPSTQSEHGDTHVPSLWSLEGLLLGWWVCVKPEYLQYVNILNSKGEEDVLV